MTITNVVEGPITEKQLRDLLKLKLREELPIICNLATVHDEAQNRSFEWLAFRKTDGSYVTALIPRQNAQDPNKLRDFALERGADLPRDKSDRLELIDAVIANKPALDLTCSAKVGWSANRSAFILHDQVIGDLTGLCCPMPDARSPFNIKCKGNRRAWTDEISAAAQYSDTLAFALSAAFAAPLVHLTGRPSASISTGEVKPGSLRPCWQAGQCLVSGWRKT